MSFTEADYQVFLARGLISQPPRAPSGLILPPVAMAEGDLQARVRRLALASGWCYYHTHDSRRSDPGFPDLVICRPGALIFAELKSAKGKLSEEQCVWLDLLQHSLPGVEVYVWRPEDWPTIQARLTAPIGGARGDTP